MMLVVSRREMVFEFLVEILFGVSFIFMFGEVGFFIISV